jgi:hypothetical protein
VAEEEAFHWVSETAASTLGATYGAEWPSYLKSDLDARWGPGWDQNDPADLTRWVDELAPTLGHSDQGAEQDGQPAEQYAQAPAQYSQPDQYGAEAGWPAGAEQQEYAVPAEQGGAPQEGLTAEQFGEYLYDEAERPEGADRAILEALHSGQLVIEPA